MSSSVTSPDKKSVHGLAGKRGLSCSLLMQYLGPTIVGERHVRRHSPSCYLPGAPVSCTTTPT